MIVGDIDLELTKALVQAYFGDIPAGEEIAPITQVYPLFPQNEFDVIKEQTLVFLEQAEVDPDILANRQFGRIAYGGHPYGNYTTMQQL